jgi:hypothetical protein
MRAVTNGYLVVGAPTVSSRGLVYRGVDRGPWETVADAYYAHRLPGALRTVYESIKKGANRAFWWPTCRTLEEAQLLLGYTRDQKAPAQLVCVFSPYLQTDLQRIPLAQDCVSFLGFDVVAVGEWSLLRVLASANADFPSGLTGAINQNGLLEEKHGQLLVEQAYRQMAAEGHVEELARQKQLPIECVAVWEVSEAR